MLFRKMTMVIIIKKHKQKQFLCILEFLLMAFIFVWVSPPPPPSFPVLLLLLFFYFWIASVYMQMFDKYGCKQSYTFAVWQACLQAAIHLCLVKSFRLLHRCFLQKSIVGGFVCSPMIGLMLYRGHSHTKFCAEWRILCLHSAVGGRREPHPTQLRNRAAHGLHSTVRHPLSGTQTGGPGV